MYRLLIFVWDDGRRLRRLVGGRVPRLRVDDHVRGKFVGQHRWGVSGVASGSGLFGLSRTGEAAVMTMHMSTTTTVPGAARITFPTTKTCRAPSAGWLKWSGSIL